jgi:hypothetical protein
VSWQAVQWALRDAPMLMTDAGKNDTTARYVLVALAEKARGEPLLSYPSIATLRFLTGLDREVIRRALQRLAAGGLIVDAGRRGEGVVAWRLDVERVRPATDEAAIEAEVEQRKARDRDRKKRQRATPEDRESTVLRRDIDDVSERKTVESTVLRRDSTVLRRDSTVLRLDSTVQNSTEPEEPLEPIEEPVSEPVAAEQAAAAALFDAEPVKPAKAKSAKPKKPADPKDAQAQDLARRYYEAMNGMVAFMGVRQIVKQALGRFSYDQVHAALKHMSTQDRNRTLTRQTLLAAIETPNGRSNGYRPYRNPTSPDAYMGELA